MEVIGLSLQLVISDHKAFWVHGSRKVNLFGDQKKK